MVTNDTRAGEITQQVKVVAAKSDDLDLSSSPGSSGRGEPTALNCLLTSTYVRAYCTQYIYLLQVDYDPTIEKGKIRLA